jgi:hypothetical protein
MQEVKHSQIFSHAFTAIKSHLFYPSIVHSKQIFRDGEWKYYYSNKMHLEWMEHAMDHLIHSKHGLFIHIHTLNTFSMATLKCKIH